MLLVRASIRDPIMCFSCLWGPDFINFMMRTLRFYMAVVLLAGSPLAVANGATTNDYVRLEVRPASALMRPGASGVIEFHFFPADGIHVNADPPVQFSLDSAVTVIISGKPVMTTDPATGYLSTGVPVKQEISLPRSSNARQVTVKGTVTYFYCSDSEGWCNRQKERVEFTITLKP